MNHRVFAIITSVSMLSGCASTPDEAALPSSTTDFSPVLYAGETSLLLLGGVSRRAWLTPEAAVAKGVGESTYRLHSLRGSDGSVITGSAPEPSSEMCKGYFVSSDDTAAEPGAVGVLDSWPTTRRPVTELSADGTHERIVIDWLTAQGSTSPDIGDLQAYRVDIEGDGVDEVLIHAAHLDGSQRTTAAGDYSIVLMRKATGDDAHTVGVVAEIHTSAEPELTFPPEYSIADVIDLDQDGILEVVVGVKRWEGFGAIVNRIDGDNVTEVLRAIC